MLTSAAPAAAQDVVRLVLSDCETASASQITKLVTLELASQFTLTRGAEPAATLTATLACSAQRAVIRVQDVRHPKPLELVLPLSDTRREARPRLLALAVAELIATSSLELERTSRAPESFVRRTAPPQRQRVLSLGLSVGGVRAFEPTLWSPGVRLDAAHSFGRWSLHADAQLDSGSRDTSAAALAARVLSFGIAPALKLFEGRLAAYLGVGLRAGAVWLSARSRQPGLDGRTLFGVLIAPFVWSALELQLSPRWYLGLALELAYVLKGVSGLDAANKPLLELSGLRAAAWLGVGVRL